MHIMYMQANTFSTHTHTHPKKRHGNWYHETPHQVKYNQFIIHAWTYMPFFSEIDLRDKKQNIVLTKFKKVKIIICIRMHQSK